MCIYERDFAQNNAVLKRKENEHGKNCSNSSNKISLPIQATAEDLTDQRTRIKNKSQNSSTNSNKPRVCDVHMLTKRGLLWNLKIYH